MKDCIGRVANALGAGATAEDIYDMLVNGEGMSVGDAYLTYKAGELLLQSREEETPDSGGPMYAKDGSRFY